MKTILFSAIIFTAYSCNLFQLVGADSDIDNDFFSNKNSESSSFNIPTFSSFNNFYITSSCGNSATMKLGGHNLSFIDKIEFIHTTNAQNLGFEVASSSFLSVDSYDLDNAVSFSVGPIGGASSADQWDAIVHTTTGEKVVILDAGSCGP